MKIKMISLKYLILVCLMVLLSACSTQIAPAATSTTEPTKTVTATSTPEPTKTVTATSTPEPTVTATATKETFTDPFSYCASVETIDMPDARYTGNQIPDDIINGFKRAAGLEKTTEPIDLFKKTTIWRCMDHKVYACNFGANLPCNSKANTYKTPSQDMNDYCAANPESDFIPMSVTGHTTIYSWYCVKSTPKLLKQIEKVDAAGYWAQIWYKIVPNH